MTLYIIISLIILVLSCEWDIYQIAKDGSLKGEEKSMHVTALLSTQILNMILTSYILWGTVFGVINLAIPSFIIGWVIKDMYMGLRLHGDITYLGTGWVDRKIGGGPWWAYVAWRVMVAFITIPLCSEHYVNILVQWIF